MMNPIEVEQALLRACLEWALAGVNYLKNFVLLTGLGWREAAGTTGSTVVLLTKNSFKDALEPLFQSRIHWITIDQTRDQAPGSPSEYGESDTN
jgi:hypothetical protein